MPWQAPINSEILSVHAALVPAGPNGRVLMFGGDEHNPAQGGTDILPAVPANVDRTALFDVGSNQAVRTTSPTTDVFCAGHAFLGDGRLLVGGGTEAWGSGGGPGGGHVHQHGNFGGHQGCWIYNHHQNTWRRTSDMNFSPELTGGGGRWYPSLVTLPSGDVAAFGGHPSRRSNNWHENDLPERYSVGGRYWSWYPNRLHFDSTSLPGNWYPRVSLIRGGWLFFTSIHNGSCRFFDPVAGTLVGPVIPAPPEPYNSGWDYGVIQLPLVPGDGYRSRIMAVDGRQPKMIELNLDANAPIPNWRDAGARQGSATNKRRKYACPVYLPTGQIIVTGGINGDDDDDAVKTPEVYTPDINWATRTYGAGAGTWETIEENAAIARNYHNVALLLPDGSVFTASSSKDGDQGDPATVGQLNLEIFQPGYFDNPGRPELTAAPMSLNYADNRFTLTIASTAQATSIRRVALVRCGSVTHAGDFDQRYVVLNFAHTAGSPNLVAELPRDASVMPPGNYMLWVVNQNGLPCKRARFVRFAHQSCTVITDRSTFSKEEVQATRGAGQVAIFNDSIYVRYDGFIHTELTGSPTVEATWDDTGAAIPPSDFNLALGVRLQETTPGFADTPQRITFPFHIVFQNLNAYNGFTDRRRIRLRFTLGPLSCEQVIELSHSPNPYMIDIDPPANDVEWLSTDVRVFSVRSGQSTLGVTQGMGDPIGFIRGCLDRLNDPNANGDALFNGLSTMAKLDLASHANLFFPVFNYAIARVRYRAVTTTAQRVKCFFRMFNVQATGLEFDPNTGYRRSAGGPNTVPLLGKAGGAITSIPFFASPRRETVQGRPNAGGMDGQVLDPTYEIKDLPPEPGETTVYFGAWLDINQRRKLFPLSPGNSDGPWPDGACQPIQDLVRGRHMCVVAEVFYELDPTNPGATPSTSDNLSQRNLAILNSDNPGGPDSHTVVHTFELKPSLLGPIHGIAHANVDRRGGPDELMIKWHNLPPDSKVTIYFSDVNTHDVRTLAQLRQSPWTSDTPNQYTLATPVGGLSWIPIPGGRTVNIPALLSIELPQTVVAGNEFRVTIHQVSGQTRRIIGSCEFRIRVSSAELILDEESRDLSVLKHIASTIPLEDRWYPLMKRYVHLLGKKVDALGGDADSVHPNPDGSGRPWHQDSGDEGQDTTLPTRDCVTGTVDEIVYDGCGRFTGFVLSVDGHKRAFAHRGKAMERLVRRACRDELSVTVCMSREQIRTVTLECCG